MTEVALPLPKVRRLPQQPQARQEIFAECTLRKLWPFFSGNSGRCGPGIIGSSETSFRGAGAGRLAHDLLKGGLCFFDRLEPLLQRLAPL